jgi:hypothetical protein
LLLQTLRAAQNVAEHPLLVQCVAALEAKLALISARWQPSQLSP